jgi:mannose-6-phosphate isomerase-like protein (cupin superfamily)
MMGRSETSQIRREKPPVVYDLDDYRQSLVNRPNDAEVTITRNHKVDLWTILGGQTVPLHMHSSSECLLIVLSGHGEYQLGDHKYDIKKDMMAVAPPATPHAIINNNSDALVVLTVEAPGPFDVKVLEAESGEKFY